MHKVFKPARKGDRLQSAYLYRDGHVVVVFERNELGTRINYVKIAQSIGIGIDGGDFNRVVFHNPAMLVNLSNSKDTRLAGYVPSVCHGSPNTKAQGILVGYISVNIAGAGSYQIHETGLISAGITIQNATGQWDSIPETKFDGGMREWGGYKVVEIYKDSE